MRDFDQDDTGDYKGRDIKTALEEAKQMVDTILTPYLRGWIQGWCPAPERSVPT